MRREALPLIRIQANKTGSKNNQIELQESQVRENCEEQLQSRNGDTEICIHNLII